MQHRQDIPSTQQEIPSVILPPPLTTPKYTINYLYNIDLHRNSALPAVRVLLCFPFLLKTLFQKKCQLAKNRTLLKVRALHRANSCMRGMKNEEDYICNNPNEEV